MKKIILYMLVLTISLSLFVPASAETDIDKINRKIALDTALHLTNLYSVSENELAVTIRQALTNLANEDEETFYKVMNAIAQTVDEHSCYYNKEQWEEMKSELSGVICGIGVTAMVVNGYFEVVTLIDNGSAKEGGIKPGDRIIEADGVDITGTNANLATNYITGEEGTMVTLKVLKKNGNIITLTLERRIVVVPSVTKEIVDNDIGYIYISSFTEETPDELKKMLDELRMANIKDVIVDLRNNGGGVMDSGIACATLFMDKGEVVISTKDKKSEKPNVYKSEISGYDFNTVILTNKYTASASEIMASAIVENDHAVSVGEKTYGKASAQTLFPLVTGGAFRVTTMYYYTAKDVFINKEGLKPTFSVENEVYRYTFEEIPKLSYSIRFKEGDVSDEVLGIETMLYKLGYLSKTPDNTYDEYTKDAVYLFQQATEGLSPYGVCDLTTQTYLMNEFLETDFYKDTQLEYAIKYLNDKRKGE